MTGSACQPFTPARRPGGRPAARPRCRVLVHRKFAEMWSSLPDRVGPAAAQQFYDHAANTPGQPTAVNRTGVLRGKPASQWRQGLGADRFITNNQRDFPTAITEINITYPADLPDPAT